MLAHDYDVNVIYTMLRRNPSVIRNLLNKQYFIGELEKKKR